MAKTKTIKAVVGVQKISDAEFLKQLNTVHDRVNGNTNFPNPPVDMPTFKAGIDTLTVSNSRAQKHHRQQRKKEDAGAATSSSWPWWASGW